MPLIDPNAIVIPDSRQRKRNLDFSDVRDSIRELGQIQPIVVRKDAEGNLLLVAGWRRTMACRELGVEIRFEDFADLPPDKAREIELEENLKRRDLHWRDLARTIGELHDHYLSVRSGWTQAHTARRLSLDANRTGEILAVYRQLDSEMLSDATSIDNAYSVLQRASERRAASIVAEILATGASAFQPPTTPPAPIPASLSVVEHPLYEQPSTPSAEAVEEGSETPTSVPATAAAPSPPPAEVSTAPIICADFIQWANDYSGPKFNLVHCDFPYGIAYESFAKSTDSRAGSYDSSEDTYFALLNALCGNIDKIMSYSSHLMFWFSMDFYEVTRNTLTAAGLWVQTRPLVWHKTDNAGIVPGSGGQYPRQVYETAFLCSRGKRPLLKASGNAYGCPTASTPLHPSHKPEPMLKHFFGMLVDSTTDMLDPTCGSGASVRAAEDCGARNVLGIELHPEYFDAALASTVRARILRDAGRRVAAQ